MKNRYSIEQLIETFEIHSKKAQAQKERQIREYKEDYPDSPLPEHFKDDFSLAEALKSMCEEIRKMKNNHNDDHNDDHNDYHNDRFI